MVRFPVIFREAGHPGTLAYSQAPLGLTIAIDEITYGSDSTLELWDADSNRLRLGVPATVEMLEIVGPDFEGLRNAILDYANGVPVDVSFLSDRPALDAVRIIDATQPLMTPWALAMQLCSIVIGWLPRLFLSGQRRQ